MSHINTAAVSGNLTRDPEVKTLPSGTVVADMAVACSKSRKVDEQWVEETSFFDITAFAGLAELCGRKLRKGDRVTVQGELKQDQWEKDGQKRSKVKIVARQVDSSSFFKKDDDIAPSTAPSQAPSEPTTAPVVDDIPF